MKSNKIIIISGKQGSGKTTLMEALSDNYRAKGVRVHNVIFADTIYQIHNYALQLLRALGIERDIVKDGKLLQLLGTEWGRATLGEDIWVRCLKGQIEAIKNLFQEDDNVFLISDCRFRNEFEGIPEAFKIRLECPKDIRQLRCSQWRENDTHLSEIDLDGYAEDGLFDLYVDTESDKVGALKLVLESIEKGIAPEGNFLSLSSKYYPKFALNISEK